MEDNKENKEMNMNMQQPAMMPAAMPAMMPSMPMVPMMCCPYVMSMQCPMMCGQNMMGMPTAVSPYEMNKPMANPFMASPFPVSPYMAGPMPGQDMNSSMFSPMTGAQY